MPEDGSAQKVQLTLIFDPSTGKVRMQGPQDPKVAYAMLKSGLDMTFQMAMKPEPERKVKTLDELGMSPGGRMN